VFGLAYRGEDKKASAAAWIVLVSRSRNGMIFPVICSSSADVPDNVPESRVRRRAASRLMTCGRPRMYRITGHYPVPLPAGCVVTFGGKWQGFFRSYLAAGG
jgi:hypothetical protein